MGTIRFLFGSFLHSSPAISSNSAVKYSKTAVKYIPPNLLILNSLKFYLKYRSTLPQGKVSPHLDDTDLDLEKF